MDWHKAKSCNIRPSKDKRFFLYKLDLFILEWFDGTTLLAIKSNQVMTTTASFVFIVKFPKAPWHSKLRPKVMHDGV